MTEPIPCIEPDVPGRDGRAGLLLRVPYRRELVAELKACLSHRYRYWDEGIAAWWIDTRQQRLATRIVLQHFPALVVLAGPGEETTVRRSRSRGTRERAR